MLTGEFTGIKVLATVTVAVAMVLAALAVYLCLNRSRQNCNCKGDYKILHSEHVLAVQFLTKKHTQFNFYIIVLMMSHIPGEPVVSRSG